MAGRMTLDSAGFFARLGDASALGTLFDYLPDVYLFVKDLQHRFTMVNRALWKLHGCASAEEMLGRTDWDFHPPVLARQYIDEDKAVMRRGRPLPNQIWLVPGADRLPRWYVSTKIPLVDRAGAVMGIAGAMRPYDSTGDAPGEYRRLSPALEHVLRHFAEPLTMGELAKRAHLSLSQFQREFRRLFGIPPSQYVLEVRLQTARRRLETTRHPVGLIALECGFSDHSYFTRCFRRATGLRPLEYRRRFGSPVA